MVIDVNWNYMQSMHTMNTAVGSRRVLTKQDALKIFVWVFVFICWRNAFWIHGKSIKTGQNWKGADMRNETQVNRSFVFAISGMFMKYNTLFWTMTLARRKQWLWRPQEMGISRTVNWKYKESLLYVPNIMSYRVNCIESRNREVTDLPRVFM